MTQKKKKTVSSQKTMGTVSPMTPENEEIKMTQSKEKMENMAHYATAMSKEQMDAFMQSGNRLMKGTEDFMKICTSLFQDNVEKNSEAFKSLMSCKTLNELTETQARLAQDSFDSFISNAAKLSEMSVKLATEAFEPINSQMSKTMSKSAKRSMDSMAA